MPPTPMKRYIVHVPSGRYLQPNGCWSKSRDQALVFADAFTAIRYCVREQLGNAELLLHFDDAEDMDLHISLKARAAQN
jgi:hypothetical protein